MLTLSRFHCTKITHKKCYWPQLVLLLLLRSFSTIHEVWYVAPQFAGTAATPIWYSCAFRPGTSDFGLVFFLGFAPQAFNFTLSAARQQWFEIRVSSPRQTVFLDLRALSTRTGAYNAAPARMMNPSLDMWGISEGTVVPPTALPHPW